ncbi:MAG: inositol monophosphatase family protein [Planctomycetota bacterium]|nr:inositol monophosphatase family protein [Planctomycetota bacterium]
MDDSLADVLVVAQVAARKAGNLLLEWSKRLTAEEVRSKSVSRDLVTEADLASEAILISALKEVFPEDGFLAEETGSENLEAPHVWYVDPLDGTNNFVHGLPMYAVSLARVTNGVPDVAVVFIPRLQEMFTATKGGGSFLNDRRIEVSGTTELLEAMLATGFPYRRHKLLENNLENFQRLFLQQRGVRRMGSAACDLAYVACGRLDAYWELHLSPYDVAAGGLLVSEAGGTVDTIFSGGSWLHGKNILAAPPDLLGKLRDVLQDGRDSSYPPLGEHA